MATAAPSPLASSVEKTNGAKLSRLLIDGGTTVLRTIFDVHHPPANLIIDLNANYPILNNLLRRRVLNGHQWDKLFPPGGVAPDSQTFDITLLFLLLTNICGLTPPPSGWHTKPPPSDTSHEANLARVKFYRNILYGHVTTTGIDAPTFSALWTEISGVLVSLGLNQAEVDKLNAEKGGEQDYIDVLVEWDNSEEDIKTQLRNMHQSQSQTHQAVEGLRQAQEELQNTLEDLHQTHAKTRKTVEDSHQTHVSTQKAVEDLHQTHSRTQKTVEDLHQTQTNTQMIVEDIHQTQAETQMTVKDLHQTQASTKKTVEDIHQTQAETQMTVKDLHQTQASTKKTVEDIHQSHAKTQKTVEKIRQTQTETHQNIEEVHQTMKEVLQTQVKTQHTIEEVRHENAKNVDEGLKEIMETIESLKEKRDEEKADEVLRSLAMSEFSGDIEYHLQRFQEGTREWVFEKVQNWVDDRSSQNRVMVISANAGMGKSVISAVICKRMQQAGRLSGSHFCQYNNVRYCKPQLMIQSLACHFSHALPEYKQALLEQLSRNLGTDLNNMGVEELFALLFKEPLSAVGDPGRNMLMVVDGLDENECKGRNELLDVIANQFCKLPFWIRFLVTTRPALNIAEKLKHLKPLKLKSNDAENVEDVRAVFQKNLQHVVKLGNLDEYVKKLVLKSEGLMLYAHFLVLLITENPSIFHDGDVDDSLPLGISSFYHSYFKRLESELCEDLHMKEEHFLNLLAAVATSREPLPVDFVSKVLVTGTDPPLARRKVVRSLSSVSALFPIRDDCLQVIHKSVKDWLTDVSCYGEHQFIVDENEGHRILAALCTDELENVKRKGVHNLQFSATERYALYHGAHHMLHEGFKREPHKLNELTKAYIVDLEIVYAKTCVNSTIVAEDLVWLKRQGSFTLLSKDNQRFLDTLLFLLRKNHNLLTHTPRSSLQTILNQGGKALSVEASNLLQNKYPEIPFMEVVHKEMQRARVVALFKCSSTVLCLEVSPQLDYMVCECDDGMLQLWSLYTGSLVWTRPVLVQKSFKRIGRSIVYRNLPSVGVLSLFRSVVFHPRKECILPGILSQAYSMDGDLKPLFLGSNCRFSVCSISGDKTKILTNCLDSSKCLVLWSLESGSEVDRILVSEDILSFAWSGDGRLLVISHSSGVISLYDVMCNFRKLTQMATPEVCGMVKFALDHRFIFCCAVEDLFQHSFFCLKIVKEANNTFSLTIVSDDSETFESFNDCGFLFGDLITTKGRPFRLTFGLDKQRLLRSFWDAIEMVDTKYVNRNDQGVATSATGIALSLDGQIVFVSSMTSVTAYDVSSGKLKAEIKCGRSLYRPLCLVSGGVLILTSKSTVELWCGNLAKRIKRWTNLPGLKQLIPISKERVAVVAEVDVKVLDTSSGKVVSKIPVLQGRVLSCNSKCQLLIERTFEAYQFLRSGPWSLQLLDGETVVWRKKDIERFPEYNDKAVAFSPMEQFLVVGTTDGTLVLDPETGNTLRTLGLSFSLLRHCTFISDDTCVISGGDLTVRLFNVKSGEFLTEIDVESRVNCLAACPFNRVLAIGLRYSAPSFKVIRVHLPRGEDRGNMKR